MNRIGKLRKEQRLSQKALSEKLKVHQTAVSQWETGRTSPGFDILCEMAKLFDVSPTYIMGTSDTRGLWPANHVEDSDYWKDDYLESIENSVVASHISRALEKLNEKGQAVAVERVEELTKVPDYQKDPDHRKGSIDEQKEE